MTSTIENIYSDFRAKYIDKPDFVIDFYDQNTLYFTNIRQFNSKEELKLYVEIICKYIEAVYQKDHYNLAVDLADKEQIFIDKEIQRLDANDIKDAWYYSLAFVKGMASYNLKDFKTSTPIFNKLVHWDNQNDNYKRWLTYSKYGQRLWLIRILNVLFMVCIVCEILLEKLLPNLFLQMTLLGVGLLGVLTTQGYEFYVKRSFRKTNNK